MSALSRQQEHHKLIENLKCRDIAFRRPDNQWEGASISSHRAKSEGEWAAIISTSFAQAWSCVQATDAAGLIPESVTKIALFWRDTESVSAPKAADLTDIAVLGDVHAGTSLLEETGLGFFDEKEDVFIVRGFASADEGEAAASNLAAMAEELCGNGFMEYPKETNRACPFADVFEAVKFANLLLHAKMPNLEEVDQGRYGRWNAPEARFFYYEGEKGSVARDIWDIRRYVLRALKIWSVFEEVGGLFFSPFKDYSFNADLAYEILNHSGIDDFVAAEFDLEGNIEFQISEAMRRKGVIPDLWTDTSEQGIMRFVATAASRAFDDMLRDTGMDDICCDVIVWPDRSCIPEVHFVFPPSDSLLWVDVVDGEWAVMFLASQHSLAPGDAEMLAMMATGEVPSSVTKALVVNFEDDYVLLPDGFIDKWTKTLQDKEIEYIIDLTEKGANFGKNGTSRLLVTQDAYDDKGYVIRYPQQVLPEVTRAFYEPCFRYRISELLWRASYSSRQGISSEIAEELSFGLYSLPDILYDELPVPMPSDDIDFMCVLFSSCYDDDMERWVGAAKIVCDLTYIWEELLGEAGFDLSSVFPAGSCQDMVRYIGRKFGVKPAIEAYFAGVPIEDIVVCDGDCS